MNTAIIIQGIGLWIGLLYTPEVVAETKAGGCSAAPPIIAWALGWTVFIMGVLV